jgi:hypothetical protein
MRIVLIFISVVAIAISCKSGKGVSKTSYYTDSLKMEQAIKITMKKLNL